MLESADTLDMTFINGKGFERVNILSEKSEQNLPRHCKSYRRTGMGVRKGELTWKQKD